MRRVGDRQLSAATQSVPAMVRATAHWLHRGDGGEFECAAQGYPDRQRAEFASPAMEDWAARNGVELRFIQPGKLVQNAYIESSNSPFRDECLSQHRFASLSPMRSVIDN